MQSNLFDRQLGYVGKWRMSGRYTGEYPSIPGLKSRDKKDGWGRLERAGKRRITAIRPVQRPRAARRDAYARACNGTPHLKFKCSASHRALRIASALPFSQPPPPPIFFQPPRENHFPALFRANIAAVKITNSCRGSARAVCTRRNRFIYI